MQNRRLAGIIAVVPILLLIPFVAMQFTDEVNWTFFDFLIMGFLLLSTAFAIEIALRLIEKTSIRIAVGLVIFAIFLLIWAELAVGIFGTPFAGS